MNRRALAAGAAVLALCTGCGQARWDRSGAIAHPQELVIAANDAGGTDAGYRSGLGGAPGIARFIEQVSRLSHGRVSVHVAETWEAGGTEADVIQDVGDGKADLGWASARSLSAAGIETFRPLDVPFLVDSYAEQAAVVTDPVADRMLAALTPRGLTGLALVAGELELPASTGRPLQAPADYRGQPLAVYGSVPGAGTGQQGIEALGARPSPWFGVGYVAGVDHYAASWWTLANHGPLRDGASVTVNTPLWAHTLALFGSSRRLSALDAETRGWLDQAAREASTWSVAHAADGVGFEAQVACGNGAGVVMASMEQVAALHATTADAFRGLGSAEASAVVAARIRSLAGSTTPEPTHVPATCAPFEDGVARQVTDPQPARPGRPGAIPNGTYRYTLTEDEIRASGADDFTAHATAGVWTWTLHDGSWRYAFAPAANDIPDGYAYATCRGWYDVVGSAITFALDPADPSDRRCAPYTWKGFWRTVPGGLSLALLDATGDPSFLFSGKPWERIG